MSEARKMKFTYTSLIAVMLVVIAVAIAGCSGSNGANQLVTNTQAAGTASGGSSSSGSGSSGSSSSGVSGASLFGGLNYNWVEYKMSTSTNAGGMTIYMKFNKQTGKCSMRFEGAGAAQMPANMQNIDCSSKGGTTQSNPNTVPSDATVTCSPIPESVTVPAGTFSATKCTITAQGHTSTAWIVKDKFMVKMEATTDAGAMNMVLNAYG